MYDEIGAVSRIGDMVVWGCTWVCGRVLAIGVELALGGLVWVGDV